MRLSLAVVCVPTVLFALACSEKDTTPPPAPRLDPVATPTSEEVVILTGSAEYGATVTIKGGASTVEVEADPFTAEFRAELPLNTSIPDGSVSIVNTITLTATDAEGNESDATTVEIEFGPPPGIATEIALTLTEGAADGVIAAGDVLSYTYAPVDAYGTPTDDPVIVVMNAPDAVVLDDGISGTGSILNLTRAGTYTLSARAVGGAVETVTITVEVAPGDRIVDLTLTLDSMPVGNTVLALTVVRDLFGNVIETPAPVLSIAAQNPATINFSTQSGNEFTITKAGVFLITAEFDDDVNPAASDTEYILVEPDPDVIPPAAAIEQILFPTSGEAFVNGRIEVQVAFSDDKGLADGVLYAQFGSSVGCSAQSGLLVLGGSTALSVTTSVRVPTCAFPLDTVTLVAKATDQAGNLSYSAEDKSLIIYAPPSLEPVTAETGYDFSLAAYGDRLDPNRQDNPADIAVLGDSGVIYTTMEQDNRIRVLFPDHTQITLVDANNQRYDFDAPSGIAISPDGVLFVADDPLSIVFQIQPYLPLVDGNQNPPTLLSGLSGPRRLSFIEDLSVPLLCVAQATAGNNSRCYSNSEATPAAAALAFTATLSTGTMQAIDITVATPSSGSVWLLNTAGRVEKAALSCTANDCATNGYTVGSFALAHDLTSTATDLVALPSGDVAVADNAGNRVVRISAGDGSVTEILTGLDDVQGLDFAGELLYVLDRGIGAVFAVTGDF